MSAHANNLRHIASQARERGDDAMGIVLESAADEIERLRRVNGELRTIFRVNMLRAYPTISHADIDAAMTMVPE